MENLKWLYSIVASGIILISVYFFNSLVFKNPRKQQLLPPGPRSLPIIGHLHFVREPPVHKVFQRLAAHYGHVLGLKLGNRYVVVISSPAAVEECFGKNDIILADRPQSLATKYFGYDNTTVVSSNYNCHWRNLRRISNQEIFSVSRQNMFVSVRQAEVKSMIKSLCDLTRQGTRKVEMKSRIGDLVFNIVLRTVTGKKFCGKGVEDSAEVKDFRNIVHEIFDVAAISASKLDEFLPFLRLICSRNIEKKMLQLQNKLDLVLQNLINEGKTKDGKFAQSMISNLLTLQETEGSASVSDQTIKGLMSVLFTAGTDTAAYTIEWVMSLLLNNPDKLKKATSELDAIISPGRLANESDLPKLTYLQAIIYESMRMYPVGPLLLPHYSSNDCTIQGFHVPKGTLVFANVWAIHRDPLVWEDPLSFKPERFENDAVEKSYVHKFLTFGSGRRSCPGKSLGFKMVGLTVASLIQCFEWERIGEEEVDMREMEGLTMGKFIPLEAMCKPRSNMIDVLSDL